MTSTSEPAKRTLRHQLQDLASRTRRQWRQLERDVRNKVTWSRLYRATSYAQSALWIVPFVSIVLVMFVAPAIRSLDAALGWRFVGLSPHGAETLYDSVITLTLSFVVFTFGSLLVAIQIASGQLSPRIIATTLLRDSVVRYSVGLFVFTLLYAIMAENRLEAGPNQLVAFVTGGLGLVSVMVFLFLIDYAARLLRPVAIVSRVSDQGLEVIKAVYPNPVGEEGDTATPLDDLPEGPRRVVTHASRSQIILAVNLDAVMRLARRSRGVVELIPKVGDFLATGEALFVLHGGATEIDDQKLRDAVAFGSERTMEQDPLFGFRILVDIAIKALSPAINDPTTAVLVLDQIHRLLRALGRRRLQGDTLTDGLGHRRVIFPTPNWEDFVHLACHEIRAYGAGNVQVARRLRAMLDNLVASLPQHRHAALVAERDRLDQALTALYPVPGDLALARVPDSQGLGGSTTGATKN